jgi:hypothetical protein
LESGQPTRTNHEIQTPLLPRTTLQVPRLLPRLQGTLGLHKARTGRLLQMLKKILTQTIKT